MSVEAYCQKPARTIDAAETAQVAAERMDKDGVGCLVVVEKGRPVGILTDRELVLEILCNKLDASAVGVTEIAARPVVTIAEDAPLAEAAQRIRRHAVRRLAVVDNKGKLVGVIAADDLLQLVVGELGGLAKAVRSQSPSGR
ncbi:MAG: CBS domain-containing protein [Deltaproteobacteria bacterium]|nr:MAG: CBS domain-containing protein [Deltaproteobacteria bacterium]